MARPKKPRYIDGHELPANLYPDPKKRGDKWRYVRPDGRSKTFNATLQQAIDIATKANESRAEASSRPTIIPQKDTLQYHVEQFIKWRESTDDKLKAGSKSWTDRKNYVRKFVAEIGVTLPQRLEHKPIQNWWEELSYHGQHNRRPELMRFINYLMLGDLAPSLKFNPFNKDTSQPHLTKKAKPKKKRARLDMESFWAIYRKSDEFGYHFLKIAMALSLMTTLRRDDICTLRLNDINGDELRKVINKSLNQRGVENAAYLAWDLNQFPLLRTTIQNAREVSLVHMRCPFILSHSFKRKYRADKREHGCQVLPDYLSRAFSEVRDASGLFDNLEGLTPPTFHEVRSLASNQFDQAGYRVEQVQELMAHTDEKITKETYQSGHQIEWTKIDLVLTAENIGGEF